MIMLGNGEGVVMTIAVGLLATLLPFSAFAEGASEHAEPPTLTCHGHDGAFKAKFSNHFNDRYSVAEFGCEFPGVSWLIWDCRTGDGLLIADGASGFSEFDDLVALRTSVYEQIGDGTLEALESKVTELGIASKRLERRERISCPN